MGPKTLNISRSWLDNDSPDTYQKNEKLFHLGGVKGSGFDKNENIVFDISKMKPDGSYHGDVSVDVPAELKEVDADGNAKNLRLLVTLTGGSQREVIELPVKGDGSIQIARDDELAEKLFAKDEKGLLVFKGKFLEVARLGGLKDGAQKVEIIATHTGEGTLDKGTADRLLHPKPEVEPAPVAEEIQKNT